MHVSWLGNSSIRLQTKNLDNDINIIIDPYKPQIGDYPRSLTSHIAILTKGQDNLITLSGQPFIINTPGEFDIKNILITSLEGNEENSLLIRIDTEQMSIGHLGLTNKPLNQKQEELFSDIDILFIPIGHPQSYNLEQAMKIIANLEPRIIIPTAFKSDNDPNSEDIQKFLTAMGIKDNIEPEKKVIIKQKDLPQEETKIFILKKE